jgi:hypothetical protein
MRQATGSEGKVSNTEICKKLALGIESCFNWEAKDVVDYTSVCIASLMHKGNSLQQLCRYSEKSFRIETLPSHIVVVHYYVNSRAKQFEDETLMASIGTFMKEIVE